MQMPPKNDKLANGDAGCGSGSVSPCSSASSSASSASSTINGSVKFARMNLFTKCNSCNGNVKSCVFAHFDELKNPGGLPCPVCAIYLAAERSGLEKEDLDELYCDWGSKNTHFYGPANSQCDSFLDNYIATIREAAKALKKMDEHLEARAKTIERNRKRTEIAQLVAQEKLLQARREKAERDLAEIEKAAGSGQRAAE